jgi:hypothetical protein
MKEITDARGPHREKIVRLCEKWVKKLRRQVI